MKKLVTCVLLSTITLSIWAAVVSLGWTASVDPSAVGYKIYYGVSSRNYTNVVEVGTNLTGSVSNLIIGTTYYFAATCYNIGGLESDYSAEIAYAPTSPFIQLQIPTLPRVIKR